MVIPKQFKTGPGRFIMEHNPFIGLNDGTEITYSDLKFNEHGQEYVTIYFETPAPGTYYGFCDATIDYPISNGQFRIINHYTKEKLEELMYHYNIAAKLAFKFAKEDFEEDKER